LGVSYKRDVGDWRESPALDVIKLLQEDGAEVLYHDPHVPEFRGHGLSLECSPLSDEVLEDLDLVIVLTDHSTVDYANVVARVRPRSGSSTTSSAARSTAWPAR